MRLPSLILAGLLTAAVTASPASAASSSSLSATSSGALSSTSSPRLAATLASCATGDAEDDRAAVFVGSMPRRARAARLWMRFDLQRRTSGSDRWTRVSAGTFSRWEKSRRGVGGFVYRKRVEGLPAPGTYRVVVRFRWKSASGRTLRSATRTSRACRQPDPRPDLRVERAVLSADGTLLDVTVLNAGRGRTTAPAVVVARLGDTVVGTATVAVLAAGDETSLRIPVPPCGPYGAYDLVVDPADVVEEADEDDNRVAVTCFR